MTSQQIRQQFLDFFASKGHRVVPGSPVVPYDDPTLLFANAGMNQFKDVFLGTGKREYTRAADTQKCIRVSGKHNDLEEVGHDTYHHTLFEMLGNWSFGDYYKKEAIAWAWELLTEVYKLPKERLFATVYRTDDEALELWKTVTDIKHSHILKFDEKDNFWEMGETGPCGPCSEIHINLSDDYDDPSLVNAGSPLCIEIWNLVFIQFNRDANGDLHELPAKHVDTGMGFERLVAVIQGKSSNYDSDVFQPIIKEIEKISGASYSSSHDIVPIRVIADHIRTLAFAIADGAVPSNEGRGYVLRRILRRAARYGRKINLNNPFLYKLVDTLAEQMGHQFPEIIENKEFVKKIIRSEEESFNKTLDRGIHHFEEITAHLKKERKTEIPGADAFKLYDTYGFPVDLTRVMATEHGYTVDEAGFDSHMKEQRARAREATKSKIGTVNIIAGGLDHFETISEEPTQFLGYESLTGQATVTGLKKEGDNELIILDKTPFYVEAGGQIDDTGVIRIGENKLVVDDVLKNEGKVIHVVDNAAGVLIDTGMEVLAEVDRARRWDIMRNHSATHFMHAALRNVLGTHVQQAGSYVGPDRLRFDFSHFGKVTKEELTDIETIVNEQLRENIPLTHHRNMPIEKAKQMGALMFFGDKYGDLVNVVQFGDRSVEFCGGTHVHNSSEIGLFKVISESSISSGVRRIEAVTGAGVERFINQQFDKIHEANDTIEKLLDDKKKLEKEIAAFKLQMKKQQLAKVIAQGESFEGINLYYSKIEAESNDELKQLGDDLRDHMKSGVGLLLSVFDEKVGLVCVVTDDLIKGKNLSAGKIVGDVARIVGGGGGGRPQSATAGGKDITKVDEALREFKAITGKYLSN
ncbi:MAG: alanine--tRNA ligase [Ignavibacteriaceae bacterium]|nr:MAG: alanine--tRNA ligase [Chlorobiota bacterium]GJQ32115.1 MAG: alanine--tRNA ligase [Ignavibacteriaceae bacterium]